MSNQIFRWAIYALIALAAFGAGAWLNNTFRHTESPAAGKSDVIFALDLPDLDNRKQSLRQWRGKVLVVNFWATWCAPCREEIPMFVKVQEKYRANGLQFVGISIDHVDKTSEFATNFKINYPTLIGTFDAVEVSRQVGNTRRVLPYTVIVDRKGEIAATEFGGMTQEKLESILKPLL